jgi:hypothetical protein
MSGVELCKVLVAAGCDPPIVLISGATEDATRDPMKTVDAIAALYKPLLRDLVLTAPARCLPTRKQSRSQ